MVYTKAQGRQLVLTDAHVMLHKSSVMPKDVQHAQDISLPIYF